MSELKPLSILVSNVTDKVAGKKDSAKPYVGLEHMPSSGSSLLGFGRASDSISTNNAFRPGDTLFGKLRPQLRKCVHVSFDGYCSTDILVLRASTDANADFAAKIIQSEGVFAQAIRTEEGTKMPRTSWRAIKDVPVFSPPLPQQRKIARILATVDNLIEKTEALIAKYQAIKQGMMHDLFTRGVDEHGHLRPPHEKAPELYNQSELGWIPKEWDCVSFGNFIVAGPQNGLYKPISSYSVDGSPIVRIDGFYDGQLCDTKSFRRLHLARAELAEYVLEADDILVNRVNSIDYVGKSAIVPELQEATVFESNIMRLKVNRERLLPDFAIRLLCHYTTQHQFRQSAKSAVAQASINQSDIRRCVVAIPRLKEQVCVVERCRSFDRQVDCDKNYLEKLRLQKTGLMQDLLTGKVRVKVDEAEEVAAHA